MVLFLLGCEPSQMESEGNILEINYAIQSEIEWSWASAIKNELNKHRDSLGLQQFSLNQDPVSLIAGMHSKYMIHEGRISHDDFYMRSAAVKNLTGASSVGEVIAYGQRDAETVIKAWLQSNSHRELVELPKYNSVGIGVLIDSNGAPYITVLLCEL